jgi:hypothetical protein
MRAVVNAGPARRGDGRRVRGRGARTDRGAGAADLPAGIRENLRLGDRFAAGRIERRRVLDRHERIAGRDITEQRRAEPAAIDARPQL